MPTKNGGFVIGTGDLSELALGLATYNGDHMSMYGVNAERAENAGTAYRAVCGRHLWQRYTAGRLVDILDTPVSPELLPTAADGTIAQQTEKLVGPYELSTTFTSTTCCALGSAQRRFTTLARTAVFDGKLRAGSAAGLAEEFLPPLFAQQFKRSCLPDGPKVGSVTLSPRRLAYA